MMINTDILIVGAGLSGLMAAQTLREHNLKVMLVDKGRSVGGRLATRRIGPGRADHGAQFFTVRTPEFEVIVNQWMDEKLVFLWSVGWSDGSQQSDQAIGQHPRYAVRGGMNQLAKYLAQALDVRVNTRLTKITRETDGWRAEDEAGNVFMSQALILTPPVPQSLDVLRTGGTDLAATDLEQLEKIRYAPCLAGLFWIDGVTHFPKTGGVQLQNATLSWLSDNQRKGISPEAALLTAHANPDYSQLNWETPPEKVMVDLTTEIQPFLANDAQILEAQYKRWRYALPTELHDEAYLQAQDDPTLIFAGDAFGGPRVEGAALSGLAAANILAKEMVQV